LALAAGRQSICNSKQPGWSILERAGQLPLDSGDCQRSCTQHLQGASVDKTLDCAAQALVEAPLGSCLSLRLPSPEGSASDGGKGSAAVGAAHIWCIDNAAATFTVETGDAGRPAGAIPSPAAC